MSDTARCGRPDKSAPRLRQPQAPVLAGGRPPSTALRVAEHRGGDLAARRVAFVDPVSVPMADRGFDCVPMVSAPRPRANANRANSPGACAPSNARAHFAAWTNVCLQLLNLGETLSH